jgi:hypothetical protein
VSPASQNSLPARKWVRTRSADEVFVGVIIFSLPVEWMGKEMFILLSSRSAFHTLSPLNIVLNILGILNRQPTGIAGEWLPVKAIVPDRCAIIIHRFPSPIGWVARNCHTIGINTTAFAVTDAQLSAHRE